MEYGYGYEILSKWLLGFLLLFIIVGYIKFKFFKSPIKSWSEMEMRRLERSQEEREAYKEMWKP